MDQGSLCFTRIELLAILQEGKVEPLHIENDRQLTQLFQQIHDNLACEDDWQKRISAMHMLQALAWGDLSQHSSIMFLLRNLTDKLGTQIADLRSQVCKECCKTIAILSYRLGALFAPIVDLLWAKLSRLVSIKVQVMAKAADSCIRVIILSCQDQRLLSHVIEGCDSKAVTLRRVTLEYLCIIFATWRKDLIEKNSSTFKAVLMTGLRDADSNTRKLARLMFRFARENDLLGKCLSLVFDDQESTVQRLLQSENLSSDLNILKHLSRSTADEDQISLPHPPVKATELERVQSASSIQPGEDLKQTEARVFPDSIKPSERRLSVMGPKRIVQTATLNTDNKPMQQARLLSGSVRLASDSTDPCDESSGAPTSIVLTSNSAAVRPSTRSSALLANGARRVLRDENALKPDQIQLEIPTPSAPEDDKQVVKKKGIPMRSAPEMSIEHVRNMISDPQWVNRLKAYEIIAEYIASDGDAVTSCVEFSLIGLQDSHQKIMMEVTKIVNNLLNKEKFVAVITATYIADLLSIIFVKLTDSRALIRDAASSLINTLKITIPAESLVEASMKVISAIPESARVPAIQFYCSLLSMVKEMYSTNGKNIREAISKICWLTANKESTRSGTAVTLSVKKILSYLWEYNAEAVCREILKLSFHQQTVLKSYLRVIVPDCETVFLKFSKSMQSNDSSNNAIGKESIIPSLNSSSDQVVSATITNPCPTARTMNAYTSQGKQLATSGASFVLSSIIDKNVKNETFEGSLNDFFASLCGQSVEVHMLPKLVVELHGRLSSTLVEKENVADRLLNYIGQLEPGVYGKLADILLLKGLSVNLSKASRSVVEITLHKILPLCFTYLEDSEMIFRQASLLTLVELYLILRSEILPQISTLTSAQRKLLLIYAEKRGAELVSGANQQLMQQTQY